MYNVILNEMKNLVHLCFADRPFAWLRMTGKVYKDNENKNPSIIFSKK